MSPAFDLLVAGRPSVDLMFAGLHEWPALGRDIECDGFGACAGTSFNTPAAANRLGLRVAYVATIGTDPWSRMIADEFAAELLPTDYLEIEDRPMPVVSAALNLDGDRGFVTHWGPDDGYDERLAERAAAVASEIDARHLHGYADEDTELESTANRRGLTVSLDGWGGPAWSTARPLSEVLERADVVFANEAEATAMTGQADPERALGRLSELCPYAVIKRGSRGALARTGADVAAVDADPVDVVDTTGAGDSFNAGFLLGWLGGLPLEHSLTLGVLCGTRAVGDFGGYRGCPREHELRELAAARGITLPSRRAAPDEGAR